MSSIGKLITNNGSRRRRGKVRVPTITLAHGGGGQAMHDLIDDVFLEAFDNEVLKPLDDQARLSLSDLTACGDRLAFTTDSYVVNPLDFPGGNIGKLAICGTVNDLAVGGAIPLYLTCAVIVEEGLPVEKLREVARTMATTAQEAGVQIVTGDTKVVERGACDKLFINTAGIGVIRERIDLGADKAQPGDVILVNGLLGDHGAAILNARGDMSLTTPIESDCACLHGLIEGLLSAVPNTRFMRDATRGGLATVLNEIADAAQVGIEIHENRTPIRAEVKGFCELLGLDPLYLANEGKIVCVVPPDHVDTALAALQAHPLGTGAARIGEVTDHRPGRVVMQTVFGGRRIVDMLVGEQLPRICYRDARIPPNEPNGQTHVTEEYRMTASVSERIKAAERTMIRILDQGEVLELDYDGAVCQHPGSLWWGTAVGFRAMQMAALALSQEKLWSRDDLYIVSGHPGPGVRDTIEYVTGVVGRNRYQCIVAEGCNMQCNSKMKYEWWVSDGERTAFVQLRRDFVPVEFYALSDRLDRSETTKGDIKSFKIFKVNLSTRVWIAPLEESFSVEVFDEPLQPGELPAQVDEHYFDDVPSS